MTDTEMHVDGETSRFVEVAANLEHAGSTLGLLGVTSVAQQACIANPSGGPTTDSRARNVCSDLTTTVRDP